MSASPLSPVDRTLGVALDAREGIERARETHRQRVVEFMYEARRARWTWQEIGDALHVSETGARRFYFRNRGRLAQA